MPLGSDSIRRGHLIPTTGPKRANMTNDYQLFSQGHFLRQDCQIHDRVDKELFG
jgi:hypothetical protein